MDCFDKQNKLFGLFFLMGSFFLLISSSVYSAGYFQLHNLMSQAQKNVPNNRIFNDSTLNLENQEKGSGHIVNTQFSNNGGIAGCGISSTLVQYMYHNRGD